MITVVLNDIYASRAVHPTAVSWDRHDDHTLALKDESGTIVAFYPSGYGHKSFLYIFADDNDPLAGESRQIG